MGKTLTRQERKSSRYTQRDKARQHKTEQNTPRQEKPKKKPRQEWLPHSEIEVE